MILKASVPKKPEVTNTVRTIYSLNVIKEGDMIIIRVTGNGFTLQHESALLPAR